ncbi:MAG: hypothetical protein ABIH23_24420 [bacterium]
MCKIPLCIWLSCLVLVGTAVAAPSGESADVRARTMGLSAPYLLAPADGAQISVLEAWSGVLFSWAPIAGAASYQLEWIVYGVSTKVTVTGTSLFKSLQYSSGTRLDWRVRALDENGSPGAASETRALYIGIAATPTPEPQATPTPTPQALTSPELLAPDDGIQYTAEEMQEGVTLEWTAVRGSTNYHVSLVANGIPQPPIETDDATCLLSLTVDGSITLRWAVQAIGSDGQLGPSSISRTIEVSAPTGTPTPTPVPPILQPPELISPANLIWIHREELSAGIEFHWTEVSGAAGYALQIRQDESIKLSQHTSESRIVVSVDLSGDVDLIWAVATVNSGGVAGSYSPGRALRVRSGNPGDLDLNGKMDAKDLYWFSSVWASSEESPVRLRADLDGDYFVSRSDLLQLTGIAVSLSGHERD